MTNLPTVREDSYLTLHYRIVIESGPGAGSIFIDTFDGRPATLQLGVGQWAPGMEQALLGRTEGDCFSIHLAADRAYGDRNPELVQRVSRQMLAENAGEDEAFSPGDLVSFTAPNGGQYSGVLKEIDDQGALFDFNHPLAGRALRIDIDLLGVI
ncbi:MAG: FKBP-type peptidyl-prolyl cis-trans isomerase [Burkholderiaceae bacterium]|nr:FKBP-type peptidyl-prolyl cis-trans isomerase [Burkholderiaceae bacterium]MCD8517615.1 FKBP-type peptidyl-prolyl cis-trans isomerase [Burkholderiaceae bacterium]MCD8537408.1 FKBP-type peptidyl-prolyl cis-trans isomerase [Burkholderiaceae bacterium]MCD8565567.1 FKBP-type peptidyl-prolyl cis-trans isomerase [Burkholderiaceae bacterium]